jgi:hypothetical protein
MRAARFNASAHDGTSMIEKLPMTALVSGATLSRL